MNPVKAIIKSYKASAETRWQQFFILIYLFLINVLGFATIAGSLISIPLSYILIEKYYFAMNKFKLFD
jgi:hypothetical protein